jgi:iron complex outermembrane receptor protein
MSFEIFDVERIEILRGPQGTLYGKNAIGGAINVVSTKPGNDFYAKIKATIGNYGRKDFAGVLSGPLTNNISAKVSFSSRVRDGWVQNIVTGHKLKDENVQSVRGQLLWFNDKTEVMLSGDSMRLDQSDIARIPVFGGVEPLHLALGGTYKKSTNPQDGFAMKSANGVSMKVTHDFEESILTSISAYRTSSSQWEMDSAGVPQVNVVDQIADFTDQYSQEFRLTGDFTDSVDYVMGLFYLNEKTDRAEYFRLVLDVDDRNPLTGAADRADLVGAYRQINTTNSFAAFTHLNWQISEKLKMGLGLRYTYEQKDILSWSSTKNGGFVIATKFGGNLENATGGAPGNATWSDLSPKIALNYQATDDLMIYANASKGFKSGGFGAAPASAVEAGTPLAPEIAWNYEIGSKSDLFDGHLRLNLAAFYTNYKNLQFQRFGPLLDDAPGAFGVFLTRNAGNANVYGLEAEFTWVPTEDLYISGNYSYMHTSADFNFDGFYKTAPTPSDIRTLPLTRAPKHKFSINLDYSHDGPLNGEIAYHIDWRYTSDQRGDVVSKATIQPAFDLSDANISWTSEDEKWAVSVWGKNIFDKKYISHIYIIGPGNVAVFGDPAMYGVSVTMKFN